MTQKNLRRLFLASGLALAAGISPLQAELPSLSDTEWITYFVGFQNRKLRFGITGKGHGILQIIGKKGQPLSQRLSMPVDFMVEETRPDGTKALLPLLPDTLESAKPAAKEIKDLTFRGKVKGDAEVEIFLTEERGGLSFGGRILSPGIVKNPLRCVIVVKIPDAYHDAKKTGDKKIEKAFADKIKNDRVTVTTAAGKRMKYDTDKAPTKPMEDALSAVETEFGSYEDQKVVAAAGANSSLKLVAPPASPLNGGFQIQWSADPAKDPDGKSRLRVEVK